MDAIAARASVGKNTIYRRWSSKEELVADAVRELTADAELTHEGDLRTVLLAHVRDLRHLFADPLVGRLLPGLLGELQRNPQFAAAWAERVVQPRRQAIIDRLERAREQGELLKSVDPEVVADLLAGPPFLRELFPFGLPKPSSRYPEVLLETIWRGIAPSGG
jgi:AcrR family transcriptional regulator